MRWLPGRGGVTPPSSGSRIALTALVLVLALAVGVSLGLESRALESGAAHVLLPSDNAPLTVDDPAAGHPAVAAVQQGAQGDHDLRTDQNAAGAGAPNIPPAPSPGLAAGSAGTGTPAHTTAHAKELSRAQAVALVQRRYRARVVRAHVLRTPSGQQLYVLRLLSANGMVYTVRLDPTNGDEVP